MTSVGGCDDVDDFDFQDCTPRSNSSGSYLHSLMKIAESPRVEEHTDVLCCH